MLPMQPVRLQLGALLAADTTTLAPAVGNKIALVMSPFAVTENLVLSSLTLATFTGSADIVGETGAQNVAIDPVTLQQVIEIKAPIGGYRWVTGDAANLPQTIYGYVLLDTTGVVLLGAAVLPTPITLTAAGQFIAIDPVTLTFVVRPLS